MPDIYKFSSYREYIQAFYLQKKQSNSAFSYMAFARKAQIQSSGFLLHVMKGERNLTRPVMLRVAKAMGLSADQTEYFEYLVAYDQAKNTAEQDYFFAKIKAHRARVPIHEIEDDQYEVYSKWYHSVVREVVGLFQKKVTAAGIAKQLIPQITTHEARDSFKLLQRLRMIVEQTQGKFAPSQPIVSGKGLSFHKTALLNYQKEMSRLAVSAFENALENEISMHTITFTISKEALPGIVEEIRNFKERLLSMIGSDPRPATRAYNINVNLFPVSKSIEGSLK